ncbi:hypothetical protein GIY62_35510 (plasmid) [Burkholderia plantarii]|uniref:hypothetical protein n=1 Tax=Burkholderia plantarii TaxID=41899 RepID=UPI00272BD797|nr:hypothetical protein [Burkholderia plantarii]WLE64167.1 hypothetical protein GIY62_35510 [Burkholderia plantarii]
MHHFYIKHLLCTVVDKHFASRMTGTTDDDTVTASVAELIHALRDAFELGQDVRKDAR